MFKAGAEFRERQRQFAQHVGFLGTLTREEERNSAAGRTEGEIDALRIVQRCLGCERGFRLRQLGAQIFGRRGDDRQAGLCRGIDGAGRRGGVEVRGFGIVPDIQLSGPLFGWRDIGGLAKIALEFFENGVKIRAAETESTDASASREPGGRNPGQCFGVDEDGSARFEEFWIGFFDVQGRGEGLVI